MLSASTVSSSAAIAARKFTPVQAFRPTRRSAPTDRRRPSPEELGDLGVLRVRCRHHAETQIDALGIGTEGVDRGLRDEAVGSRLDALETSLAHRLYRLRRGVRRGGVADAVRGGRQGLRDEARIVDRARRRREDLGGAACRLDALLHQLGASLRAGVVIGEDRHRLGAGSAVIEWPTPRSIDAEAP